VSDTTHLRKSLRRDVRPLSPPLQSPQSTQRSNYESHLQESVPFETRVVDMGVEKIWVLRKYRRHPTKHIASQLVDVARTEFSYGVVIDKTRIAFSQPTEDGKKFAYRYTGGVLDTVAGSFLVYTAL